MAFGVPKVSEIKEIFQGSFQQLLDKLDEILQELKKQTPQLPQDSDRT